jgi:hypothetical protein
VKSQIRITLRPNNQITITKGRWNKPLQPVSQSPIYLHDRISDEDKEAKKWEMIGQSAYYKAVSNYRKQRRNPPLDITKKSQRPKKNPACRINKPKSFTKVSGQRVRESGAAISIACENEMRFANEVTLTLPANTQEAFTALAAYSAYAVNRLFQPIRRKYGEMCLWFFVWEYQKRGALHLHICISHPDEMEGLYICSQLIEQWHKILEDISELANTCMFSDKRKDRCTIRSNHQHHTSQIREDVGRYFSKYAGKTESKNEWYIQKFPVARFWGSSRSLKRIVRENSLQFDFDYQGNEEEAIAKYTSIIESIIEKLPIVSFSSYEFSVGSQSKSVMRFYPKNRKILSIQKGKIFAEGERSTFYFSQTEFKKAKELIKNECESF